MSLRHCEVYTLACFFSHEIDISREPCSFRSCCIDRREIRHHARWLRKRERIVEHFLRSRISFSSIQSTERSQCEDSSDDADMLAVQNRLRRRFCFRPAPPVHQQERIPPKCRCEKSAELMLVRELDAVEDVRLRMIQVVALHPARCEADIYAGCLDWKL